MADTFIVAASRVQKWNAEFFQEYVRALQFRTMMGETPEAPIQVDRELVGAKGESVNLPLILAPDGPGVTGNTTLEGSEEALNNFNDKFDVEWRRNAVRVSKKEWMSTEIDVRNAAKPGLKLWSTKKLREDMERTLLSPVIGGLKEYASASEAEKDAWLAANLDRILFGSAKGNTVGTDHSASLANIDGTNDKLTVANIRLAKRTLEQADPAIRPVQVDGKGEMYICLSPSNSFRDLAEDMNTIHQNAGVRGVDNPIFQDGDLLIDNIVVKKVPEWSVIADVGAGGTVDVAANFIMGAQAVGLVYKQTPQFVVKRDQDYNFLHGVAIEEALRVKKFFYNSVQHGVFTLYTAGEPDA